MKDKKDRTKVKKRTKEIDKTFERDTIGEEDRIVAEAGRERENSNGSWKRKREQ